MLERINTFDIDGVIYMGPGRTGVYPGPKDIIITGRSYQEAPETRKMLEERGITNRVIFSTTPFDYKTREKSGYHKVRTLQMLRWEGFEVVIHFEDDPIQAQIIEDNCVNVKVVRLVHDLVEKENVRHVEET